MIHKHEPVSEEQMNWISPDETVCETLRHAYAEIKSVNDESIFGDNRLDDAMLQIRTATAMAKAMTAKLQEYNRNWRKGFWDENENFPVRHSKPIDVLFLAWDDNANTGYRFWQCAKYLGLNSLMLKGKPHAFGYPEQAPVHPSLANTPICQYPLTVMAPGLEALMESARVIHLIASTYPLVPFDWQKANVVVQHGGSVYRQNPQACNAVFNQFAKKTVIQCPDLLGLGAKNESWIYYPVDTHLLKPDFSDKGKVVPIVGHFPSNPKVKGTEAVEQALAELHDEGFKFNYAGSKNIVSWPENLKRVAGCDIIVEGCETKQGDKAYGEWGNAAIEASALGCAVFTHCLHQEQYRSEFGEAGPVFHTDKESLKANLREYLASWEAIRDLKRKCRKWAEEKHSIPATSNRLWDKVYKDFF